MPAWIQTIRNVGRLTQILNVFARNGFRKELQESEFHTYLSADVAEPSREGLSRMRRLVTAFEELGPAFVKLGQFLATREDLLPAHAIQEFRRLQDRVRPASFDSISKILESEFEPGTFASVERVPIGAASIAQVHQAFLADGTPVVLKVQRPDIQAMIETDLSILMGIAGALESTVPELRLLRLKLIVQDLKKSLHNELDFFREAGTTERVRNMFANDQTIHIPQIYRSLCRKNILCMEYIQGKKLTEIKDPEQRTQLVREGSRAFFDMTFKHGLFHADLHPGNFIVMENGKLAILDFGLTARLSRDLRATMTAMFLMIAKEDLDTFARLFIDLTEPGVELDYGLLEQDIRELAEPIFDLPLQELQVGKLLVRIAQLSANRGAPVSRELFLFFRGVVAIEAFGKSLDPDFQILKETTEYAKTLDLPSFGKDWLAKDSLLLMRDSHALMKELPLALRLLVKRAASGQLSYRMQSDDLAYIGRELDRASNRLSLALLLGALVLGSSIVTFGKEGKLFDSLATLGLIGFGIAGFLGIWLVVSILRRGRFK